MRRPASALDPSKIETPAFVIEERLLRHNLGILRRVADETGVTVLHALKAWATWPLFPVVKEYLDGTEFSCILVEVERDIRTLEVTEIHPQSDYYTYDDKYMPGRCRKFTPPKNIPAEAVRKIRQEVVKAFQALGFRSYGRIDGFLLKDGRILVTDPNSSSGMAPSSFFFEQAASAGMLPSAVISLLIENALIIHREKRGPL